MVGFFTGPFDPFEGDLFFFENRRIHQKSVGNLQSTNSSILFYEHHFTWGIVYFSIFSCKTDHILVPLPVLHRYAARFLRAMGTYFVADCVETKEEEESSR